MANARAGIYKLPTPIAMRRLSPSITLKSWSAPLREAERNRLAIEEKLKEHEKVEKKSAQDKEEAELELAVIQNDIKYYSQERDKIADDPLGRNMKQLDKDLLACEEIIKRLATDHANNTLTSDQQIEWDDAHKEKQKLKELIIRMECVNQLKGLPNRLKKQNEKHAVAQLAYDEAAKKVTQAKLDLEAAKEEERKRRPPDDPSAVVAQSDPDEKTGSGVAGYDPLTGQWEGDRPSKPSGSLKGTDSEGKPLTAHHLLPWNQIRDALNEALKGNATKLKEFIDFAEVDVEPWFWTELGKAPVDRVYKFAEVINRIATDICWAPKNIFMGPLGETRGDDPGEKLDTAFVSGGLPTMRSVSSVLTGQTGGIGATPSEFNEQNKNRIEEKYKKKLKKGDTDLNLLDKKDFEAMKKEMIEAEVWEYVREDYPNVVAKARRKTQLDAEYKKLEQQYMQLANVAKPEDLPVELAEKLYNDLKKLEKDIKPVPLTLKDLTPKELEGLNQRMLNLGEGYEAAKTEFLNKHGVASDTQLSDKLREELQNYLSGFKNSKQRLAEMMTDRATKPEGADEALPNAAREYKEEEWQIVEGKKVRRKHVKAPKELLPFMDKVDQDPRSGGNIADAILKPSKPNLECLLRHYLSFYKVIIRRLSTS